jgi:hypothetical protein
MFVGEWSSVESGEFKEKTIQEKRKKINIIQYQERERRLNFNLLSLVHALL